MATPNNPNFQAVKDAITESLRKDGLPPDLLSLVRSKTRSPDAYLAWTQEHLLQKMTSPQAKLPAADTLAQIQSIATKFADLKAITAFADAVNNTSVPIPLFQSPSHQYLVVVKAGALSLSVPPIMVSSLHKTDEEVDNRTKIHPFFYSLSHGSSAVLPKHVYPLGQLYYKLSSGDELTETNYAVVVDVVGEDHGVWLVWNRRGFNAEAEEEVITDPAKKMALFVGVDKTRNFDAVQVVGKVSGWKLGNDEASLLTLAEFEGNARRTKVEGEIVVGVAKVEELGRVFSGAGVVDWGSGGRGRQHSEQ
ncbi:uncharacterized protein QC763_510650 [Podospora pseudopauciseta]|uniref:Uncharacterized protein n=1 Tax=Podospora pseudopauciseta TaxID=2093780 RepID=A0ABR0HAT9_9PEZI|nr:hypothetical protein QC763_510650 [Podospora pseudopauciseta]